MIFFNHPVCHHSSDEFPEETLYLGLRQRLASFNRIIQPFCIPDHECYASLTVPGLIIYMIFHLYCL